MSKKKAVGKGIKHTIFDDMDDYTRDKHSKKKKLSLEESLTILYRNIRNLNPKIRQLYILRNEKNIVNMYREYIEKQLEYTHFILEKRFEKVKKFVEKTVNSYYKNP